MESSGDDGGDSGAMTGMCLPSLSCALPRAQVVDFLSDIFPATTNLWGAPQPRVRDP